MADRIPGAAWPGKKAPGGLEVLEVLVGTTHNSTSQGSLWNRSTSSVTFLSLVLAPFSGCKLRWLLTYKKKAEHSGTGLDRESLLQKSGRVCAS